MYWLWFFSSKSEFRIDIFVCFVFVHLSAMVLPLHQPHWSSASSPSLPHSHSLDFCVICVSKEIQLTLLLSCKLSSLNKFTYHQLKWKLKNEKMVNKWNSIEMHENRVEKSIFDESIVGEAQQLNRLIVFE